MRRVLSISFCRVSFTGATSPVRAWGEQTVPTRSCSSAGPGCAQPWPRAAQHGAAARAEIAMHPALLNKAPSPTSCKNQSLPDSIYIGTVPRQRIWFIIQITPHKGTRVSCLKQTTDYTLLGKAAALASWDLRSSGMCLHPGVSAVPKEPPASGTLLSSAPFPCLRQTQPPKPTPANLHRQSTKPR